MSVLIFACKASVQDAGREGPSISSPLSRRSDGNLRIVDLGDVAYLFESEGDTRGDWIELYASPTGNSPFYLGCFEVSNFTVSRYDNP